MSASGSLSLIGAKCLPAENGEEFVHIGHKRDVFIVGTSVNAVGPTLSLFL